MRSVINQPGGLKTIVTLEDGNLITGSVQDCTPFVENASKLRQIGEGKGKDVWHTAHYPPVVVEAYCNNAGIDFHEFMSNKVHVKRMLNDPALASFRVVEGRM